MQKSANFLNLVTWTEHFLNNANNSVWFHMQLFTFLQLDAFKNQP